MEPLRVLSPIHRAVRQIERHLQRKLKPFGVSAIEGHLMTFLLSYAPCSIAELHRVFGLKRSTLTSVLDRLERRDLIARDVHPADRRSWMVRLRPQGTKLATRLRKLLEGFESDVLSGVSPGELRGFGRVLDSIAEAAGATEPERKISSSSP